MKRKMTRKRTGEGRREDMYYERFTQAFKKPLTYREREVLNLRYGIGDGYIYTQREVGTIFQVSPQRICQIEASAIRRLQHPVCVRLLRKLCLLGGYARLTMRGSLATLSKRIVLGAKASTRAEKSIWRRQPGA